MVGLDLLFLEDRQELGKSNFCGQGFVGQFTEQRFVHRFLLFDRHLREMTQGGCFFEKLGQSLALGR